MKSLEKGLMLISMTVSRETFGKDPKVRKSVLIPHVTADIARNITYDFFISKIQSVSGMIPKHFYQFL